MWHLCLAPGLHSDWPQPRGCWRSLWDRPSADCLQTPAKSDSAHQVRQFMCEIMRGMKNHDNVMGRRSVRQLAGSYPVLSAAAPLAILSFVYTLVSAMSAVPERRSICEPVLQPGYCTMLIKKGRMMHLVNDIMTAWGLSRSSLAAIVESCPLHVSLSVVLWSIGLLAVGT